MKLQRFVMRSAKGYALRDGLCAPAHRDGVGEFSCFEAFRPGAERRVALARR